MGSGERRILVGRISCVHGLRGWVKVYSYTDPRENIVSYSPWQLKTNNDWVNYHVVTGRRHGKSVIVKLATVEDRDDAENLRGAEIAIWRDQLANVSGEEYYWTDLEGLEVVTTEGISLGRVDHLMETGANDVLVVKGDRERLIPFIRSDVIVAVRWESGVIEVAWDPDF